MRWFLLGLLVACGRPPGASEPQGDGEAAAPAELRVVATERGPTGGRLVALAEDGSRIDELTEGLPGGPPIRDTAAVFSPDGRWLVFASSRGRQQLGESSLWIVATQPQARPRRLTIGDSTDLDPAFTPDGRFLVYASIVRGGANLDLWRVGIDLAARGGPALRGAPERLTDGTDNEMQPSVAADGSIAFMAASDEKGSSIWIMEPAGGRRQLTRGPADMTPSFSPDGKIVAFASAVTRELPKLGKRIDTDLFQVPAAGGEPQRIVDEPRADQLAPRWSRDGRWLFATSVVRQTKTNEALLTSVVYVDLRERPPLLRWLWRSGEEEQRSGPTVNPTAALDVELLHQNALYEDDIGPVLKALWERRCRAILARDPNAACE